MNRELTFWAVDETSNLINLDACTSLDASRKFLKQYTLMFGASSAELIAVMRCACGCGGAHADEDIGSWAYSLGEEIEHA